MPSPEKTCLEILQKINIYNKNPASKIYDDRANGELIAALKELSPEKLGKTLKSRYTIDIEELEIEEAESETLLNSRIKISLKKGSREIEVILSARCDEDKPVISCKASVADEETSLKNIFGKFDMLKDIAHGACNCLITNLRDRLKTLSPDINLSIRHTSINETAYYGPKIVDTVRALTETDSIFTLADEDSADPLLSLIDISNKRFGNDDRPVVSFKTDDDNSIADISDQFNNGEYDLDYFVSKGTFHLAITCPQSDHRHSVEFYGHNTF